MKFFLYLTLPLFILDQITKEWAVRQFPDGPTGPGEGIEVIPGFFYLVRVHNTGMAWGIGNGSSYSNLIFLGIAALAVTFIAVLWRRGAFPGVLSKIAVALLVAGIAGNVFDRLYRGYVVDFLDFYLWRWNYPVFNVADSCICIAAGLLILASFRETEESDENPATAPSASD